jgi:uncharacterized protein YfaP (DUF2135 family)
MTGTGPRVEVVIDELVLHGFDPARGAAVAEALAAELAAGLEGWRPGTGWSAREAPGGSFPVSPSATPAAVGAAAARQVRATLRAHSAPAAGGDR